MCGSTLEAINLYGNLFIQKILIEVYLPNKPDSCHPGFINKQKEHNHSSSGGYSPENLGSHGVVRNRYILTK